MVQAVAAAAITTGAGYALGTITAAEVTTAFFVNFAISTGAGIIGRALADNGADDAPVMNGRSVMFRSPVAPHQVVYGEAVVSGPIVYAASSDTDNRHLHLVIPLAGHEVEAIDEIYFNDQPASEWDQYQKNHVVRLQFIGGDPTSVTLDGVLFSAGTVPLLTAAIDADPKYIANYEGNEDGFYVWVHRAIVGVEFTVSGARSRVEQSGTLAYRINKHLGTADQLADANLVSEVAEWTSDHRLRGIAYIYVRLTWDPDWWPNGVPNIKAKVRGKNDIVEPRNTTTGYHENWALVVNDYLRSQFGFGCDAAEIDQAELINAANVSDELVEFQPGQFHNRYRINGAFTLDRSPLDVLEDLVSAGGGAVVFQMGQWHIHPGAAVAAEAEGLGVDDLRGPIRFQSHNRRQNLFNAIRGTFINPLDFYQQTDFPPVTNAAFEAEDGGEQIFADISLPFTDDVYAAQRLATIKLLEHRNATVIEWPAKIKGLRYRVWDVVPITVPAMGWTNKLFRVIDFNLGGLGGPDLVLQAYDPAVYFHDVNNVAAYVQPPVSSLPSPRQVLAPTDLTLYSGTAELVRGKDGTIISQIRADWYRRDGLALEDEVQYKESAAQTWITAGKTREQELLIGPVSDATLYDVRVRTINTMGVKSDWLEDTFHFVTGKAEVPPDPAGLAITVLPDGTRRLLVTASKPLDFGGYIFRARAGSHATWDSLSVANGGIDLHTDPVTSQPWDTSQPASGDYTFGVKIVDTSGNESTNAYIAEFSLGNNPAQIQSAIAAQAAADAAAAAAAAVHRLTGDFYQFADSQPTTPLPGEGSYNFSTDTLTAPVGWSTSIPSTGSGKLWQTQTVFKATGSNPTTDDATNTFKTPFFYGRRESITFTLFYQTPQALQPSAPATGAGSYNFETKTLVPPPGWDKTPPSSGVGSLWEVVTTYSVNGPEAIDDGSNTFSPTFTKHYLKADVTADNIGGIGVNIANYVYSVFETVQPQDLHIFGSTPTYTYDQSISFFGAGSLKISWNDYGQAVYLANGPAAYNIKLSGSGSEKLIVSAYVRSSVASYPGRITLVTSSGSYSVDFTTDDLQSNVWERLSGVFNLSGDNSTQGLLYFDNQNFPTSDLWVDGIMLETMFGNITSPSPYSIPAGAPNLTELGAGDLAILDLVGESSLATSAVATSKIKANAVTDYFLQDTAGTTTVLLTSASETLVGQVAASSIAGGDILMFESYLDIDPLTVEFSTPQDFTAIFQIESKIKTSTGLSQPSFKVFKPIQNTVTPMYFDGNNVHVPQIRITQFGAVEAGINEIGAPTYGLYLKAYFTDQSNMLNVENLVVRNVTIKVSVHKR